MKFYALVAGAAGSIYPGHSASAAKSGSWFWVESTTIDLLSEEYNIVPDLVKIDVEGAEYKALMGATNVARQQKTSFFVEMHSPKEITMEQNAKWILGWCSSHSYQPWYLKDKCLLEEPEQIKHRGRCHLLLLPNGENFPDYLNRITEGQAINFNLNQK